MKLGNITKDMYLRGNDPTGHGYYGAKRGTRKHKGLDIVTVPGEDIISPISGHFRKLGQVYSNPAKFKYIEIVNDVYRIRLMYVTFGNNVRFKTNDRIAKGQVLGKAQAIASHWGGGMANHVHVEVYKNGLLTDPEPILNCQTWEKS